MVRQQKKAKRSKAKSVLRLPDPERSKNAVLNSLAAASSQESYGHAIDESIGWYCSEPRLAGADYGGSTPRCCVEDGPAQAKP